MHISRISNTTGINNIQKLQRKDKHTVNPLLNNKQAGISALQSIPAGYFLISFGAAKKEDIKAKEEYFRLPEGCKPDNFQLEAGKAISEGKDVLVEAPTGTGKTAIAHYAASKNMQEGKTTFYTTPLKALSNQKLNEFRAVYGEENVGILTGDRRENVEAPIIIMTTEVYRNMALSNMYGEKNPLMDNLGTVIFDEFHYLDDPSRGAVWEESIMFTPKNVQTLELSATIGNPNELKNWIGSLDENEIKLVSIPPEARAVPLKFDFIETGSYKSEEKKIKKAIKKGGMYDGSNVSAMPSKPVLSDFKQAVEKLNRKEQLPAIFFVFSRNFSRQLQEYLSSEGPVLTTKNEQEEIEKIVNKYQSEKYIGCDIDIDALKKGYAIHNAGIMPQQKELIEELFQKKLTKVVISTETLAAGINMPAKTVVISSPYKPEDSDDDDLSIRTLTPNEFKQMAGRAGRRGIDEIGYVYTMPVDRQTEQEFCSLEGMPANSIRSKYEPDYAFLSGFYEHNSQMGALKGIYDKSFYASDSDKQLHSEKVDKLINLSRLKTNVLKNRGFLELKDGRISLTPKGYMASKVRGYDALTLVETIADKKFAGISPETLAMTAGALANPVKPKEAEIGMNTDLSYVFDTTLNNIDTLEANLESSVKAKLKKLGKNFDEFETYADMLQFAQNISKPDISEEELDKTMSESYAKRKKAYIITKTTGKSTASAVAESLRKDETVPTKILQDSLDVVEKYKRKTGGDIKSHLEKLHHKLDELDTTSKGNKAKARIEKNRSDILDEIHEAEDMQYLDENLLNAIGDNFAFLRSNPLAKLKTDCDNLDDMYVRLTSKDILIEQIKGLMSITDYKYSHNLYAESEANQKKAYECLHGLINKSLEVYETEMSNGIKNKPERYGKGAAYSVYQWALLNKISSDSMSNWQQLLKTIPLEETDEGTLYRRMMQTADLLSQIGEIAEEGGKRAESQEDIDYYANLKKTASQARSLLIKEPVTL